MINQDFAPLLEQWYGRHQRKLPWRLTRDPYPIWLSEVILQQTRVAQGKPYYERLLAAFPTVQHLAQADLQQVLQLWQGLGYYSRARNMHATARQVSNDFAGVFPNTYNALLTLKGIGTYTAAAIASFAFGERVAVVDGNVYRVLARVFGIEDDITTLGAKKKFAHIAQELIAYAHDPATYNQAIMEFGAIQCTPVSPDCLLCPLQQQCVAFLSGRQAKLPVKTPKAKVRDRYFLYLVWRQNGKIAMEQRIGRDVWQHLYDFGPIEFDTPIQWPHLTLPQEVQNLMHHGTTHAPVTASQVLSHQRISATFVLVDLPKTAPAGTHRFYTKEEWENLPKPVLINRFIAENLV